MMMSSHGWMFLYVPSSLLRSTSALRSIVEEDSTSNKMATTPTMTPTAGPTTTSAFGDKTWHQSVFPQQCIFYAETISQIVPIFLKRTWSLFDVRTAAETLIRSFSFIRDLVVLVRHQLSRKMSNHACCFVNCAELIVVISSHFKSRHSWKCVFIQPDRQITKLTEPDPTQSYNKTPALTQSYAYSSSAQLSLKSARDKVEISGEERIIIKL